MTTFHTRPSAILQKVSDMDIRRNAIKVAAVGLLAAAGGLALGSDRFLALAGHLEDAVEPDPENASAAADPSADEPASEARAGGEGNPRGRADTKRADSGA